MSGIADDGAAFVRAKDLLLRGAEERAYSAAVLLAARGEEVVLRARAGAATLASVFDVASLTKPLVAALFHIIAAEGALAPEGRVADVLPVASPDPRFREVTFAQLLSHTSGLPAYRRFYEEIRAQEEREGRRIAGTAEGHDRVIAAALASSLEADPGTRCLYSDLGYMILGRAVEAAAFRPLDRLLAQRLGAPLGMSDTAFLPLSALPECESGRIVPTGFSAWRGKEKAGEADDENAAAMGGVAGHAGVFSTAHDLFLFAREVLRARRGEGRVLSKASALRMTARAAAPPGCPRTPGFDTPTPASGGGSQAGRLFSPGTVGHLGFTGCSLWIDLDREVTVVLLSNRVVFGERNEGLRAIRPLIHDAVMEEIGA